MMKQVLLVLMTMWAVSSSAQDVILKKDGSTVVSKVLEITGSEVKYKKFTNQNGPTYTILKNEVQAINYENGEKDTFDSGNAPTNTNQVVAETTVIPISQQIIEDNLSLIRDFNSHDPVYSRDDTKKDFESLIFVWGIKEGSVIETPEIKVSYSIKRISGSKLQELTAHTGKMDFAFDVQIKNKTDKTIFIDQGTSFIMCNEAASPYYIPTATSTTHGTSSGVGVNLGAVAGALGVGGALGTLASGVNVGGGSMNSNTTITYSQRVISIPPKGAVSLPAKEIQRTSLLSGYVPYLLNQGKVTIKKILKQRFYRFTFDGLKCGEKYDLPPLTDVNALAAHITYSLSENFENSQSLHTDFYLRQVMGTRIGGANNLYTGSVDFTSCPICFFTASPSLGIPAAFDISIAF